MKRVLNIPESSLERRNQRFGHQTQIFEGSKELEDANEESLSQLLASKVTLEYQILERHRFHLSLVVSHSEL